MSTGIGDDVYPPFAYVVAPPCLSKDGVGILFSDLPEFLPECQFMSKPLSMPKSLLESLSVPESMPMPVSYLSLYSCPSL